jgi:anti-sigma factor RsiW
MRLPLAATLALAGAGVLAYGVFSHNATLVAAQLTLDHLKCIYLVSPARAPGPEVGEQVEASAIQAPADAAMAAWERTYGWRAVLPGDSSGAGFNLVAIRRCLHGQGFVAHALYRRGDHLVSLFVFRGDVQTAGVLAIMGERAAVWSQDAQTYAVIGANSPDELNRLVALTRRSTTGPGL